MLWKVVCGDPGLRVRKDPNTVSPVIGMLEHGECIRHEQRSGSWVKHSARKDASGWSLLLDDVGPCSRRVYQCTAPHQLNPVKSFRAARVSSAAEAVWSGKASPKGSLVLDVAAPCLVRMMDGPQLAIISRTCRYLYGCSTDATLVAWRSVRVYLDSSENHHAHCTIINDELLSLVRFQKLVHLACHLAYSTRLPQGLLEGLGMRLGSTLRSLELRREGPMDGIDVAWEQGVALLLMNCPHLLHLTLVALYKSVRLQRVLSHLPQGLISLKLDSVDILSGKLLCKQGMYVQRANLAHLIITHCDASYVRVNHTYHSIIHTVTYFRLTD